MEVSWEEDVEVLKLLCFSRQNFVTEDLCGYVFGCVFFVVVRLQNPLMMQSLA